MTNDKECKASLLIFPFTYLKWTQDKYETNAARISARMGPTILITIEKIWEDSKQSENMATHFFTTLCCA
jgi:hypothetical protein